MDFATGESGFARAEDIPIYPPMNGDAPMAKKWTIGTMKRKQPTMIANAMNTPFITGYQALLDSCSSPAKYVGTPSIDYSQSWRFAANSLPNHDR